VIHVLCGGENATYSLMMMNGCNKVVNLRDVVQFQERSSWVDFDKVIQK
jgi:hypothetical protein